MNRYRLIALLLGVFLCAYAAPKARPAGAERGGGGPTSDIQTDLNSFMKDVLAKRDENWKKIQQYILDEREKIEVRGPAGFPIWGQRREYQWFIRDGYFIRSPITADGVSVPEADRRKYEDEYLKRVRTRDERSKKGEKAETGSSISLGSGGVEVLINESIQPEFIDSAYFMKFKFDNGRYALVGREKFTDTDVLKIEYYPTMLFNDDPDPDRQQEQKKDEKTAGKKPEKQKTAQEAKREKDMGDTINKLMNKNSKVTLWIEPKSKQIVKYVFDNVKMDFLPAGWLMKMEQLNATMTMSQPFKDVWLPKDVEFYFSAMLAVGLVDVKFNLNYYDYREASTSARIKGRGGWQ